MRLWFPLIVGVAHSERFTALPNSFPLGPLLRPSGLKPCGVGQSLATMKDGPVRHPADPNGFYVHVKAVGPTPALWRWVKTNTKVRTPND